MKALAALTWWMVALFALGGSLPSQAVATVACAYTPFPTVFSQARGTGHYSEPGYGFDANCYASNSLCNDVVVDSALLGGATASFMTVSSYPTVPYSAGSYPSSWEVVVDFYDYPVEPGSPCADGTEFVVMPVADYNALSSGSGSGGAAVLDKLDLMTNQGVVVMLAFAFVLAFVFGWKVAHGSTQQ